MIRAWLSSTLQRVFLQSPPQPSRLLRLVAARGERVSFQACFHSDFSANHFPVSASASAPDDLSIRIRRVGYVPIPHHIHHAPVEDSDGWQYTPGLAPDPLFDSAQAHVGQDETCIFWVTVDVPRDIKPGDKTITVELCWNKNHKALLKTTISVSSVVLEKRKDFRVGHWFYCDSIADFHKMEPFEKDFWPICEAYIANVASHGNDVLHTPVFTPPTDGVKRPTQLLGVKKLSKGKYSFDWKQVRQFIQMGRKHGIEYFLFTHFFWQWGCKNALRIYEKKDGKNVLLWDPETGATSDTYRNFLSQYIPALHRFMKAEKIENNCFFGVSDEPHGEEHLANYKAARQMLRELAPWMKVCDALSDIRYGRERITDMPIPQLAAVEQFVKEGIPCWAYFCGGPCGPYINRRITTPLPIIRMNGWACYKMGLLGFLHWGYNYWYQHKTQKLIDPFTVSDAVMWPLLPYGDPFVVYPSPDGKPIDSLRWEVFAEGLQDYALLQTLGIERDAKIIDPVKNFSDFPRDPNWIEMTRRKLLLK